MFLRTGPDVSQANRLRRKNYHWLYRNLLRQPISSLWPCLLQTTEVEEPFQE